MIARALEVRTVRGEAIGGGAWTYASARPAALGPWVDHLWAFRGPTSHRLKRLFPNGCVELLVNLGDPYRAAPASGEPARTLGGVWVAGPSARPLLIEQPAMQDVLGVRLRPSGARALIARPMTELAGDVELEDLMGAEARQLRERLGAERDVEARLVTVAGWLYGRLTRAAALDRAMLFVVDELVRSRGAAPIASLQRELGVSKRRLVAGFRDHVGLTPKLYARVVRFHHALGLLQRARAPRLTELAFAACFYDQPHMNAEFRALAGITPTEFLAARHPVGDGSTAAG